MGEVNMSRIVFTNGTVLDGIRAAKPNSTVVVDGRHIESVTSGSLRPRANDVVVDLGGKTVMPGLILCHFHADYRMNSFAPKQPFGAPDDLDQAMAIATDTAETLLASGVTGFVGAGCSFNSDT